MRVLKRHDWYDRDIGGADTFYDDIIELLLGDNHTENLLLSKTDIIALAKEFGLIVFDEKSKL